MILGVVAPVLHVKVPLQLLAVNVADSPSQQIVLSELIFGLPGATPCVIVTEFELGDAPQALLHVAE